MPGNMEFAFQFTKPQAQPAFRKDRQRPMRILVMGDFSGRCNRGVEHAADLAERPVIAIDVDNFDEVLYRFAPRLQLPISDASGPRMDVAFKALDDFHPDQLYQKLALFDALRQTRHRLSDPATFVQAAEELRREAQPVPKLVESDAAQAPVAEESDASMFERLLGKKPVEPPEVREQQPTASVDIEQLIKNIVSPYIVPDTEPLQRQYLASVDAAVTDRMRAILHGHAFQRLESLWRSLAWLVTNIETSEDLKLYVLDVTKEELAQDIAAAGTDVSGSRLYKRLVEQDVATFGGEAWSLLVGHYTFGTDSRDLSLLAGLGAIASQAGGPFLAGADAQIVGCRSIAESPDPANWEVSAEAAKRWQALRRSWVAPWIGLALPRFLLRLPYGDATDAIDQFALEELNGEREHAAFLWGNPALACALLLARAFQVKGWDMQPGDCLEMSDLPAYIYEEDGESKCQASAEVYLSDHAGEVVLQQGVMPLLSCKARNAVRVMRFQSIAEPLHGLEGLWG